MGVLVVLAVLIAVYAAPPTSACAEGVSFGPYDVRSVFHVEKSENENQVHYAIRLDRLCRPIDDNPVFGYWRRLKRGVRVDEPLVGLGRRVYGASDDQRVVVRARGGQVTMYVKAVKQVTIDVTSEPSGDTCQAIATATIRGERVRLSHAFLQLTRFGFGVSYIDVFGERLRDGVHVSERLD